MVRAPTTSALSYSGIASTAVIAAAVSPMCLKPEEEEPSNGRAQKGKSDGSGAATAVVTVKEPNAAASGEMYWTGEIGCAKKALLGICIANVSSKVWL